jgi:WD40 repeat protein
LTVENPEASKRDQGGRAILWDTITGEVVQRFEAYEYPNNDFMKDLFNDTDAFPLLDGEYMIARTTDRCVNMWNVRTGRLVYSFKPLWKMSSMAVHPNGKRVASLSPDGKLTLWDTATGQEVFQGVGFSVGPYGMKPGRRVAFSPNGERLAANGGGNVEIWNAVARRQSDGAEWK